jgi:asparagine synthase (glutamine-hydrolysing)
VSRLAAERVKVVLTGEGSDETLAGYGRYRKTILNMRLGGAYQAATPAPIRSLVRHGIEALPASRTRQRALRTFFARPATLEALYLDNFAVFSREEQRSLIAADVRRRLPTLDPYATATELMAGSDAKTLLDRLLYVDTKTYLHELLMKQDQMSMACSLESRVPFLDHPFVEFAATVPENMKIRNGTGKYIMKRAVEDLLPHEIVYRNKMGFPTPLKSWLRDDRAQPLFTLLTDREGLLAEYVDLAYVEKLIERQRGGVEDCTDRLWRLLNLQLWGDLFLRGRRQEHWDGLLHAPALA